MSDLLRPLVTSLVYFLRLWLGSGTPLGVGPAAWYLGVSVDHLRKLAQKNEVAYHRPGGKMLYFLRDDLNAYALRRRRNSGYDYDSRSSRGGDGR